MLEAVYIDLTASRSVVGTQPEPPFYPLFEALKQMPEAKVTLFNPGSNLKTKDSITEMESENFGLVETGEGRTLPETRYIVKWLSSPCFCAYSAKIFNSTNS
jgi:hypothetical protein